MLWSNTYNALEGGPLHIQSPLEIPANGHIFSLFISGMLPDVGPCPVPCGGQIGYGRGQPEGLPVLGRVYPRS